MIEQRGAICGLAHIGVFTEDMAGSIQFYQDLLGFSLKARQDLKKEDGVTQLAFLELGSCIIELIQPANLEKIAGRSHGHVDHIAMSVTDVAELTARLQAKGVQFETAEPMEAAVGKGARIIFLAGPSGERLEFFETL